MDKRPLEDDAGENPAKRAFISTLTPQITPELLDQFQKEAIYRQMNVYRRERDALQTELEELKKSPDSDLSELRAKYLDGLRLAERPVSEAVPAKATKSEDVEPAKDETATKSKTDEQTKEEIASLQGEVSSKNSQIVELTHKVTDLTTKIRDLEIELKAPSDELVTGSAQFKRSVLKTAELEAENQRLETILAEAQASAQAASKLAREADFTAKQKYQAEINKLEKKVEAVESNVARLRSDRDEKISALNVLKAAESVRLESIEALKELKAIAERKLEIPRPEPLHLELDLAELKELATKLHKRNSILSAELPSLEQAYSRANSKALLKIQEQAAVEARITAANVSKAKADEKFFAAMRAKDALASENARLKSSLAKCSETITVLKAADQKSHDQRQLLEAKLADQEKKQQSLLHTYKQDLRRRGDIEAQVQSAQREIEAVRDQLRKRDSDYASEQEKVRSLSTAVEKLRKQLEIKRTVAGSGAVQEQLQSLREMAVCSLCSNNWKGVALKCCGHVFCQDCVKSRLDSRMRKCPLCNCQFGHGDVLNVHL